MIRGAIASLSGLAKRKPTLQGSSSGGSEGNAGPFVANPSTSRATLTLVAPDTGTKPWCTAHVFKQGDLPSGQVLDGIQTTIKSTWSDGSAKIAILAGITATSSTSHSVGIGAGTQPTGNVLTTTSLKTQLSQSVIVGTSSFGSATWSGTDWDTPFSTWVSGPVMSSWIYRKPIGSDAHLVAWLEVRLFATGAVEILPWVENGYMKVAGARSINDTFTFTMGGTQRFSQAITLPNHTRTVLVSGTSTAHWLGTDPGVEPKPSASYLQQSELVPTYRAVTSSAGAAASRLVTSFAPLQQGQLPTAMGSAGYHPSIGLLPEWDVVYLTSSAPAAYKAVIWNAYSLGRYGYHFRDETTNRPMRFSQYPNLVLAQGGVDGIGSKGVSTTDEYTVASTGPSFPVDSWESTHHPSPGFMAYLLSGRWYFVEEMQMAATVHYMKHGNSQRQGSAGILRSDVGAATVRGAAWQTRTLFQAACITPDNDLPLRTELLSSLASNINYYHSVYVAQSNNQFGMVAPYTDYTDLVSATTGASSTSTIVNIPNGTSGTDNWYVGWTLTIGAESRTVTAYNGTTKNATVSPAFTVNTVSAAFTIGDGKYFQSTWQQDFFTASYGYGLAMGVVTDATAKSKLEAFFAWKAQSVVGRLGTTSTTDWLYRDGAPYTINVATSDTPNYITGTGPWHANWGDAYTATYNQYGSPGARVDGALRDANALGGTAYWGNLQPAISYAVRHNAAGAAAGYLRMISASNWDTDIVSDMHEKPVWSCRPSTDISTPAYLVGKAVHEVVNLPSPSASGAIDQSSMGGNSVANIVEAYSGGSVMDLRRFTLHGGGHGDMGRNDILDIDLAVDSPVWRTVKATTPYAQWISGSPYYQDGAPAAFHSYYAVQQDRLTGRLLRFNYWGGFAYNGQAPQGSGAADQRSAYVDAYDFGSNQWIPQAYGPISTLLGSETAVARNDSTGDIYALSGDNNVWKYTASDHSIAQVANLAGTEGSGGPIVVDSINQRIIRFSGRSATGAVQYDMASSFAKSTVTFIGPAAAALNALGPAWGFGCAHDTTNNAVYLMTNGGTPTIYRIRLSDFYAEVITTTGQVVHGDTNAGLWGRFAYVKSIHSVAWLGMWAQPVQVMRCA